MLDLSKSDKFNKNTDDELIIIFYLHFVCHNATNVINKIGYLSHNIIVNTPTIFFLFVTTRSFDDNDVYFYINTHEFFADIITLLNKYFSK